MMLALALSAAVLGDPATGEGEAPRHVIYLHGRIIQEQQSARPEHPEYGPYELEKIADALRGAGFVVTAEIRPRAATLDESAERVAEQVRRLLGSGVPADRITVVGASMGGVIALRASVRLQNPEVRFGILGGCLDVNVRELREEGTAPKGRMLSIREASDDLGGPCPTWKDDTDSHAGFVGREIVLHTGLSHGFLYRPLPEWLNPVVEWARGAEPGRP